MRVETSKAPTAQEDYDYWYSKHINFIDEKLPWEAHPNELRAADMYKAKIKKKMKAAAERTVQEEAN